MYIISNQDGYHYIYDREYKINNVASDIFNLLCYHILPLKHTLSKNKNECFSIKVMNFIQKEYSGGVNQLSTFLTLDKRYNIHERLKW